MFQTLSGKIAKQVKESIAKAVGTLPYGSDTPLTQEQFADVFSAEKSFTQHLPWVQYQDGVFLFDDDVSVGALIELFPADVDGRPEKIKHDLEKALTAALYRLPEKQNSPWVVQVYLQDEPIVSLINHISQYARPEARKTKLFDVWMRELNEHVLHLSNPKGLFVDESASIPWRGIVRRVRCCVYRKVKRQDYFRKGRPIPGVLSPTDENVQTVKSFCRALEQAGIRTRLCDDRDMWSWMFPWFSPKPKGCRDAYDYMIKHARFEADSDDGLDESVTAGSNSAGPQDIVDFVDLDDKEDDEACYDLAASTLVRKPKTDKDGVWYFCGQAQRFLALQPLDSPPVPGILTAERKSGARETSVSTWDQLPPDSVFVMTIVIEPQLKVKNHAHFIKKKGGVASPAAEEATKQADQALQQAVKNNKLFRMYAGVYLKADNKEALESRTLDALNILCDAGLKPIEPEDDPIARDAYLRNLPMVYSFEHDRVEKRARLTYAHHISRIMPLFGRSTGTGNPGCLFFNRVGQALTFDPFNKRDRTKTAHGLIFGSTGAGKSATINYLSTHFAAIHNPRQFIIEKGGSFRLLAKFFRHCGKQVHYLRFTAQKDTCPSLPPYAETKKALAQLLADDQLAEMEVEDWLDRPVDEEDEERFYLGEMEESTLLMITNAQKKELDKITPDERQLIRECIVDALQHAVDKGDVHARPLDVVEAMERIVQTPPLNNNGKPLYDDEELKRIRKYSRSMRAWTQGLRGLIFNRFGENWPEADLTIVDMGILTKDDNKDMLAVAMISLVNTITGIGERYQYTDTRETIVWTDEGHVITTNPTIVRPFIFGVKTWRKLSIWLIQATQNLSDYPDEAAKMLNLAEWWFCLNMADIEVQEMADRFRTQMTEEQKAMCRSTRKQPGAYVEGVVMSDKFTFLFRSVVPALALTLAMTDGDEKKKINAVMQENGFTDDLDAALCIKQFGDINIA